MSQNPTQNIIAIPAGVELGKYRIVRTLGQGGFGMTYLAEDIATGEKVVIKENLPTFCACRNTTSLTVTATNPDDELQEYNKLLTRFVEEARLLAQLNHPNIVKVLGAFEALGTAYYVMPWVGGQELQKAAPSPADITEEWLLPILRTMLGALGYLHSRNIYHRDVKPANILLTHAGAPILIDFGTARAIISDRSATLVGSPGYSPIEQITTHGKRGPWTDVYSLGATCYRLITGQRPIEANERLAEDEDPLQPLAPRADLRGRFSPAFLATIDKALTLRAKGRWQTVNEWLAALAGSTHEEPNSRSIPTSPIEVKMAPQPTRRKGAFVVLFCVLLLGAMGTGGYLLYKHGQTIAEQRLRDEQTAREEAELKAREEAERKAREEAERKAREEAERKAREEAERKAREEAERKAREEAERIAREEAERIRQAEADYVMGVNYEFGNNGYSVNYNKAVEYYRKAAEQGHAKAQCNLAWCCESGQGINKDYNEAVQWYRKAAEQGHSRAQSNLGLCYEFAKGVNKDYNEAARWYRKAAEQGFANAQCNLAWCCENGQGTTRDYREAVSWYRMAAEQGHSRAQCNLGLCYELAKGVNKDYNEAARWYRKAAEQGFADAQCNLGLCYEFAKGVNKDYNEAARWYRKAAEQGFADAQCNLAWCCENGQGTTRDYREAVSWYRKAADQGHSRAQSNLGTCYRESKGVTRDYNEAVRWYRKAAEQGNADAQCNLGWCYDTGKGVSRNYREAVYWYRKAAQQGEPTAQKNLRILGETW